MTNPSEELFEQSICDFLRDHGGYIAINPGDAAALGVKDGEKLKVTSAQGTLEGPAQLLATVPAGVCFVPYNCADVNVQAILPSFGSNTESVAIGKA